MLPAKFEMIELKPYSNYINLIFAQNHNRNLFIMIIYRKPNFHLPLTMREPNKSRIFVVTYERMAHARSIRFQPQDLIRDDTI